MSTLGISLSGLNAAQASIRTTQHNISNINTAGFRRQEVGYSAVSTSTPGSVLFYGSGVSVSSVRSLYNQFEDSQVLLNQGRLSSSEAYSTQASKVDTLIGDANSGLTSAMDSFFGAAQTVASDPTSNSARQVMLSSGANLASRFNSISTAFNNISTDVDLEIAATVTRINTYSSQVAKLNGNIARVESGSGQLANDLRDQRDQMVAELNKLINVTPVQQDDGAYNLFIGSGQPLVVGTRASTMTSISDPSNPESDVPALNLPGGATMVFGTSMLSGGKLHGLLAAREEVLQPAMRELDRLALVFAVQFNAQHRLGFDKSGLNGIDFFSDSNALLAQPAGLTNNLSTVTIDAMLIVPAQLEASDYELSFDGADYTLTRLSDNVSATGGLAAVTTLGGVAQGFTLTSTAGAPTAGDKWLVRPSHAAAGSLARSVTMNDANLIAASSSAAGSPGDNKNALLLTELQTDKLIKGKDSFASAYAQLVGRTATFAAESDINMAAFETLTSQSIQAQQSVSGVNLDEEAANLIRFQQAYQASAKAMQIASALFDELIGAIR